MKTEAASTYLQQIKKFKASKTAKLQTEADADSFYAKLTALNSVTDKKNCYQDAFKFTKVASWYLFMS